MSALPGETVIATLMVNPDRAKIHHTVRAIEKCCICSTYRVNPYIFS